MHSTFSFCIFHIYWYSYRGNNRVLVSVGEQMLWDAPETLGYQLMKNKNWTKTHVGHCVESHLSKQTFLENILPIIQRARDQSQSEEDLEYKIAELANDNLHAENDIANTINCINGRVIHEAESKGLTTFEGLYLPLACALFGRFFSIISSEIGYVSFWY